MLLAPALVGGGVWLIGQQAAQRGGRGGDLREADRLQQQSALPEAGAALERARGRLGDGGPAELAPPGGAGRPTAWIRPAAT